METVCWCGLGKEMHDGREIDAAGDMHRFNEQVRVPVAEGPFEDPEPPEPRSAGTPFAVRQALADAKKFFDNSVIKCAKSGFKFPPYYVERAEELSQRIGSLLLSKEGE